MLARQFLSFETNDWPRMVGQTARPEDEWLWLTLGNGEHAIEVLLHRTLAARFAASAQALRLERLRDREGLVVLLERHEMPEMGFREDPSATCFATSASLFQRHVKTAVPPQQWLFDLLCAVTQPGDEAQLLLVRQLPILREEVEPAPAKGRYRVVLPHAGSLDLLRTCLTYIEASRIPAVAEVAVGFDEAITATHEQLMRQHSEATFYSADPTRVGPYAIRQVLGMTWDGEGIIFHDSDDVSCSDRFSKLTSSLEFASRDMIGSHELRLDLIAKRIIPTRFPQSVNRSLARSPIHCLLHPTSGIVTSSFKRSGGFSSDRKFDSDSEYLLRSNLVGFESINLDEFLYVRRTRPGSLTTASETRLGSELRILLHSHRVVEMRRLRAKEIGLEESGLRVRNRKPMPILKRLNAAGPEVLLRWPL